RAEPARELRDAAGLEEEEGGAKEGHLGVAGARGTRSGRPTTRCERDGADREHDHPEERADVDERRAPPGLGEERPGRGRRGDVAGEALVAFVLEAELLEARDGRGAVEAGAEEEVDAALVLDARDDRAPARRACERRREAVAEPAAAALVERHAGDAGRRE